MVHSHFPSAFQPVKGRSFPSISGKFRFSKWINQFTSTDTFTDSFRVVIDTESTVSLWRNLALFFFFLFFFTHSYTYEFYTFSVWGFLCLFVFLLGWLVSQYGNEISWSVIPQLSLAVLLKTDIAYVTFYSSGTSLTRAINYTPHKLDRQFHIWVPQNHWLNIICSSWYMTVHSIDFWLFSWDQFSNSSSADKF